MIGYLGVDEKSFRKGHNYLTIVNDLARQGVLETTRGRGGGLRLIQDPSAIRVGEVVRNAETDFRLVECFYARSDTCTLTNAGNVLNCTFNGSTSSAPG